MTNPTPLDNAIFLADAIAGSTTTKFGHHFINHTPHSLILEDILSEIVPLHSWHLRNMQYMAIPTLDLPWNYQHEHQLKAYLRTLDHYSQHNLERHSH
jgi:hypothetical protein